MLVITAKFAQLAALVFKMNDSCITTPQIVYQPVDVPTSGDKSGSKSVLCSLSRADISRVKDSVQERDICEYAYVAGKLMILRLWAPELIPVEVGSVPGRGGVVCGVGSRVGSGVCCLRLLGVGVPVPLRLQRVCRLFAVQFWQNRHPGGWFWRSIAGCLSITAFTFLCQGNSTSRCFSSRTSVQGLFIRYCVSSIAAHGNPSLAILAMFIARGMSDCSSCTRLRCPAIIADMLNTYKKWVAASSNEMWLVPQPYTLP